MKNEPTAELGTHPVSRPASGWDARATAPEPAGPVTAAPSTATTTPAPATTSPASPTSAPAPGDAPATGGVSPSRWRSRWPFAVLTALLVVALGLAGYLYAVTTAYRDRLAWTEDQARAIGTELAATRGDLEGVTAELEAVRGQLTAAQDRITALADEKAQIGDDREAQAQLLDYQGRVSEAAGTVASALDRCARGQDQLITYLESAERYDPAELAAYGQSVERLCQSASEANRALQAELADR